jgi:hypothetical protein
VNGPGVYGYSNREGMSGVFGDANNAGIGGIGGIGVSGRALSGAGPAVSAEAATGIGVRAYTLSGPATIYAINAQGGPALYADAGGSYPGVRSRGDFGVLGQGFSQGVVGFPIA